MTNRQWLLEKMQNMSDEELAIAVNGGAAGVCSEDRCSKNAERTCITCKKDWFKLEHKEPIKLSDAERVILENTDETFGYICRDRDGDLYIYAEKPIKRHSNWDDGVKSNEFVCFNHLFQFIKFEDTEPYNIEELLKTK